MNMLQMMLLTGRNTDRSALKAWALKERQDKLDMYPRLLKAAVYTTYIMWGSLKLKVQGPGGAVVDATDPSVSATAKANATLEGIQQLYKQSWWAPLVGELADLAGQALAKATTIDPMLIDAFTSEPPRGVPQTINLNPGGMGGGGMWGMGTGRTVTVLPPSGGRVPIRMTANGLQIDAPGWNIEME